jgi:methionyl aminopeptidase
MTVALEPMVLIGGPRVRVLDDHWTVISRNGKLTAHFEHSIAVNDGAAEILTRLE